ncbi:MAG TPA: hypothetical protein VH593_28285 [Ktedonobacteraceae bacterium]|jgi:hypothetical protein
MRSCILASASSSGIPTTDGGTAYHFPTPGGFTGWSTSENARQMHVSSPCKLKNLRIDHDVSPGVGNSYDYIVRVNGTDTALAVNINPGALSATDSTHEVYVNDGDIIGLKVVAHGTPTPPTTQRLKYSIELEAPKSIPIFSGHGTASGNTVDIFLNPLYVGTSNVEANQNPAVGIIPVAGTLRMFRARATVQPGASTWTYTLMKGTSFGTLANTALTCQITGSGGAGFTAIDRLHTVKVNAGDMVAVRISPGSSPAAAAHKFAFEFIPDNDADTFWAYGTSAVPATGILRMEEACGVGGSNWTNVDVTRSGPVPAGYTVKSIYAAVGTAPGAGTKWTFTLRRNAAATTDTVDIADTNQQNNLTGQNIALTAGDLMNLSCQNTTGTPAAMTDGAKVGVGLTGPTTTKKKPLLCLT